MNCSPIGYTKHEKLGLPPMQLAESVPRKGYCSKFLDICLTPGIRNIIGTLILAAIAFLTYLMIFCSWQENEGQTKLIIIGIQDTPNITAVNGQLEILLKYENRSHLPYKIRRKKRSIKSKNDQSSVLNSEPILSEKDMVTARQYILNHNKPCNKQNKDEFCRELVADLKSISKRDVEDENESKSSESNSRSETNESNLKQTREFVSQIEPTMPVSFPRQAYGHSHYHSSYPGPPHQSYPLLPAVQPAVPILAPQLADTCLLARLLKNNVPHLHVYDVHPNYLAPQYGHVGYQPAPLHYPSPHSMYHQNREAIDNDEPHHISIPHPQDFEITMRRHTTEKPSTQNHHHSSARETSCPSDTLSCDDGDICLNQKQWCDGNVDCPDASDEARCSCVSRVDKYRLCDGYFDCPFGEDEMGCYGCAPSAFSCEDLDLNSRTTCFTKEQRCDNIVHCPNQKDEADCNMLSTSLHQQPAFAVSNTEGFLQRNFRGDWYPVCSNPYMWAHDACRRETGLIIRPPFIQMVPIDPLLKVTYLNTSPAGAVQTSDTCGNSSSVYVTCPDLLCGTRVLTTPQLLRENSAFENRLFGRNKRFLLQDLSYPVVYFGNRRKRQSGNKTDEIDLRSKRQLLEPNDNEDLLRNEIILKRDIGDYRDKKTKEEARNAMEFETNEGNTITKREILDLRDKRADTRVVGGKPSQPAAWPWVIAMYRDGKFHCGGVVLNRRWVISAAHCVQKFWDHYYEIQIGMLRRFSFSPQEHSLRVTHVIVNQKYNQFDMKNDLSLLRVDPEIRFSRWVRPICLPGPETAGPEWLWGPQAGTNCVAVGWGSTEEHGPDPDHIREVEVPIWSECKHKEDRAGNEICAGLIEGGKDACQGDSGGPLLCRNPMNSAQWYMAGIVSHGDGCGRKGEPGVYTRVSLYVKWIKHHVFSKTLPAIQPKQNCPGFKCISGILKCLPKDKRCDKIVDCLNGEDEINCNFARNTGSWVLDLFLTGEQGRNAGKGHLQTKEADDEIMSKEVSSPDFQHASTIELPNEDNDDSVRTTFRDASEEFIGKTTIESRDVKINRGDITISSEDLHSSPSNIELARETDITEDWSDFLSTTQQSPSESEKTNTVTEQQPTTTRSTEKSVFTTQNTKTDLTQKTTQFTETEETTQALINQTIETTTQPASIIIPFPTNISPNVHRNSTRLIITDKNLHINDKNIIDLTHQENMNFTVVNHSVKSRINKTKSDVKVNHILLSGNDERPNNKANLLLANNKRPHRLPEHFQCNRINQVVPFKHRCDHKADCEDGSDEIGCTCVDYITTFDQKLICDGTVDCSDGQDEINCFECDENQFLCKKSKLCLPIKHTCDGRLDCPNGEDEFDCYALTNGKNLELDFDGKPAINLEGFMTKKHENNWNIVCEDNLNVEQQEAAASHVCRYLGFSSANRLLVKYINVKDHDNLKINSQDTRMRRDKTIIPTQFAREVIEDNEPKQKVIRDAQIIKEECVPNITKTCMSLYVFCEHTLFDDLLHFDVEGSDLARSDNTVWPWVAKVNVDGKYKCTGILIDVSWVLISHSCLWDSLTPKDHTTVILGTQRVLRSTHGPYEQIYQVDAKKEWLNSKVTLLHLIKPAHYTSMVKPMAVSAFMHDGEKDAVCVAVGEDNNNNTISLFLEETHENCHYPSRCFKRHHNRSLCQPGVSSNRHWAGLISCHGSAGWHPSASFVSAKGECGVDDVIVATDIGNLRSDIKHYLGKSMPNLTKPVEDNCEGVRCARGRCVRFEQLCNGVRDCEDGVDEGEAACQKKHSVCGTDPYHGGCECAAGQLKCRNGRCVPKEQFGNGNDDCGDGSDEPGLISCAQYLARTMPSRLCDGIVQCQDKSDEDPMFCKCFAEKSVKCGNSDHCVSPDVVCDGVPDCPHGEDERPCLALSAPTDTLYGTGVVISCSHGIWHTKCYPNKNHTRTELEKICRQVGFISGHAKQLSSPAKTPGPRVKIQLEEFQEVVLNGNTRIKLRSSNNPLARAIFDNSKEQCYPVNIECL